MSRPRLDAVTGAFSYSGAAIAQELRRRGRGVRTLTNHARTSESPMEACPLDLSDTEGLRRSLTGVDTLYNTYWVRFPRGDISFDAAVEGSTALFGAAVEAGVRHVVHISITHADVASPYAYFRGKGRVEQALGASGLSHSIVRPAVLFGGDGVLINNIAWLMRRFPIALYGGDGSYRVRGIHLRDLATLMCDLGASRAPGTVDAVGPESVTFLELLKHIRACIGARTGLLPFPEAGFPLVTGLLGTMLRDVLLTRQEYAALAAGLADSDEPATGNRRITEWIASESDSLGRRYAHEIRRHFL